MSNNIINDISKVYLEQVFESTVPGKPAERLGAVSSISKDEQDAARQRTLAKAAAIRAKKGITKEELESFDEALRSREERMARMITPAQRKQQERARKGREILADIQATEKALKAPKTSPEKKPEYNTPAADVRVLKPGQKKDTVALKAKKIIGEAKKEKPKRWWDNDGDGIGYEDGEVSGKFKRKRSVKKESFSNWREDLSEVITSIESKKKIVERGNISNKININPNTQVKEAFETIGGTLIEMVEIDDFDCVLDELTESEIFFLSDDLIEEVVEGVFYECLDEGYDLFDIENTLIESLEISSQILNEAKITFGEDTELSLKEDKLQKVKGAVKKVARGIGYAAGAAVRGAKAIGREIRSGYSSGRSGGGSQTSSSAGSPRSRSSSSNSSSSSSSSGSSKPGLLSRIGSKLKSGLKSVIAKGARKVAKGASKVADRMERGKEKIVKPDDPTPSPAHSRSGPLPAKRPPSGAGQKEKLGTTSKPQPKKKPAEKPADPWEGSATTPSKPKAKAKAKAKPKASTPSTPKKKRSSKLDDLIASVRSEEYELEEKTLSPAETKKKEEIVKSMKKNLPGFRSRYGNRAKEVMYATATKNAKNVAEASTLDASTQPQAETPNPAVDAALKAKIAAQKKSLQAQRAATAAGQAGLSKGIPLPTQ
jgi:hypothetical protein